MTLSAAPTTSARRPRAASRVGVVGGRAHTRRINLHMDVTGAAGERERQRGKKQTDGTPMLPPPPPPPPPSKSNSSWRSPVLAGGEEGRGRKEGVRTISMSHESDTGGGIMPCSFRLVATAHGEIQRGRLNAE